MKKIMLAIVLLIMPVLTYISLADDEQTDKETPAPTTFLGGNFQVGLPSADWGDIRTTGFGAQLAFEYKAAPTFSLDVSVGDLVWGVKNKQPGINYSSSILPILIGGKYLMPSPGYTLYIGLDLGPYMASYKGAENSSHTDFGFSPALGIQYPISDKININGSINYTMVLTNVNSTTWYGVNLGLMFAL